MATTGTGPLTRRWAQFIAGFAPEKLSPELRARTLQMILDGSGALLAAADPRISTGVRVAAFVKQQGGAAQSSIVGQGFKSNVINAALANGTMGYACDVEPHHPEGVLHPIAVMIPTAPSWIARIA